MHVVTQESPLAAAARQNGVQAERAPLRQLPLQAGDKAIGLHGHATRSIGAVLDLEVLRIVTTAHAIVINTTAHAVVIVTAYAYAYAYAVVNAYAYAIGTLLLLWLVVLLLTVELNLLLSFVLTLHV